MYINSEDTDKQTFYSENSFINSEDTDKQTFYSENSLVPSLLIT